MRHQISNFFTEQLCVMPEKHLQLCIEYIYCSVENFPQIIIIVVALGLI